MYKFDLSLKPPILNAAGSLGFTPDPYGPVDLGALGAFITNPISLTPRSPAADPRYQAFPGGFLLHTGYPNPGFGEAMHRFAQGWARSPLPVLVHLLAPPISRDSLALLGEVIQRLEETESVTGIELGLPPGTDAREAAAYVQAALGELPLILRLPLESAPRLARLLADDPAASGIAALSLSPPRGALLTAGGKLIHGRLYGPSVFPLALAAVYSLQGFDLPVIAAGGVYHQQQIQALLSAGAFAVQLDAALWRGGLS
jgi:dihydroorotate dehydrogenase (NAD+) catalytic subunit